MAPTNTKVPVNPDVKLTKAGPGHNPDNPHPTPKIEDPIINLASTFECKGLADSILDALYRQFFLIKNCIELKVTKAPIITNARDGSQ